MDPLAMSQGGDMAVTESLAAVAVILWSYLLYKWFKDPIRKIPGPTGLPLLGNALSIDSFSFHMQLYKWAEKYGPVFKIHIFTQPVVVINTGEAQLEALVKRGTAFQGRPPLIRIQSIIGQDVAFTSYDHPQYHMLRRVTTKALRSYGAGIPRLEHIVQETIQDIIDRIQHHSEEPLDCYQLSYGFVCCVMASILFGEKYSYDDPVCIAIHDLNAHFVTAANPAGDGALCDIYPSLFKLPFIFSKCHAHLNKTLKMSREILHERISHSQKTFDPHHLRGCLDYFLRAKEEEKDLNGNPILDDNCVLGLLVNFVVGGMETTLASLSEAFLILLTDQTLQKRLHAEIDDNVGPSGKIALNSREKLPQLEAFTHENLRYLTQVPLLLPHMTIDDTEVAGYKIPRGTRVFFNAFYSSHDPNVFDDPFEFKARRFLDDEGQIVAPDHSYRRNFVGFGAGRRQCPGELLARSRIFMFLGRLLQKFDIVADGPIPDIDPRKMKLGIIIEPPPVLAKFIPRHT